MPTNLQDCPDSQTLVDFLLGKLPSDTIEDCRQHLVDCDPCVETIRGLKIEGDTIHDLMHKAWMESGQPHEQNTESQVVSDLIGQLEGLSDFERAPGMPSIESSEGRAAEVQRLLNPRMNEGELGQLGKYRIRELLGAGSTGVVYLAIDEDLDRTVALKILRPSLGELARERFIAEAKATAMLQHPNVVQIYEVGIEGPLAFISMMWEPGQTLERLLETENNLPIESVRELGTQLASALAHAHQRKLIHRDIKPANIWIPEEPGVTGCKVLDFGLVRITDEDPQLTCTGMIAGTPCYMSPEQSRGQQLDGRSDLFSLGCVLYQASTGALPFRSDNALSTLQSIQRDQPSAPIELDPSVPPDMSDLVMCLLEKSPNRRPPDAPSVGVALTRPRRDWPFEVNLSSPVLASPTFKPDAPGRVWKLVVALLFGSALGVFGLMFGPQITRIVTDQGVIEIDCKVDDIKIEVWQNGKQIRVVDLATEEFVQIKSGVYEIRPMGDRNSIHIENNNLTLTRGGNVIVTITRARTANEAGDARLVNGDARLVNGDDSNTRMQKTAAPVDTTPYRLAPGDVLGVFVDGVLGEFDKAPPMHIPPAGSDQLPSLGYPIVVDSEGLISLPLIDPIDVEGKTVSEARRLVVRAFVTGQYPILTKGSRIMTSLIRKRIDLASAPTHRLDDGDVLGVYVEGVLGESGSSPPIHIPPVGSNSNPSMGYPILVDEKGQIHLPIISPIFVRGKTVSEARQAIVDAYTEGGDKAILQKTTRILISLMRVHHVYPADPNRLPKASSSVPASVYELTQDLQVPVPLYKGKSFAEHLNHARSERDLAEVLPALEGLVMLAGKDDQAVTFDVFMQIARQRKLRVDNKDWTQLSRIRSAFWASLSDVEYTDFICRELANGSQSSIGSLLLSSRLERKLSLNGKTSPLARNISDSFYERYTREDSETVKSALLRAFSVFCETTNFAKADFLMLKEIYQVDCENSIRRGGPVVYPIMVATLAPEAEGLLEQLQADLITVHLADYSKILTAAEMMPTEQSKFLLPFVVEAWKRLESEQHPSIEAAEYFIRYPVECTPFLSEFKRRLKLIQYQEGETALAYRNLVDRIESLVAK